MKTLIINNNKKMKEYAMYLVSCLMMFFIPIVGLLIAIGVVIALDTITGVIKVIKTKGWSSFSSKIFGDVIGKMLLYQLCILLLYVIDFYLLNEFVSIYFSISFMFTKICAIILIFTEFISIKENLEEMYKINFWNKIKSLLKRGKELRRDIDKII